VRRALWMLVVVLVLLGGALASAWREGWIAAPWSARYAELESQLRDRGGVAVVGRVPWGMRSEPGARWESADRHAPLASALGGTDPTALRDALRSGRYDTLLVPGDAPAQGSSLAATLARYDAVPGLSASYLDPVAALYEPAERPEVSPDDARRMVAVARLILSGAPAPPERLFPESLRRPRPVELALIVRDEHEAILWRSARAGSMGRALLDVSFAILDRWSTRQQERFGRLREALRTRTITLALFYDKGVLGARDAAFLRRAAPAGRWSVGFERVAGWEYALPPAPGEPGLDPVLALTQLARERAVPAPGYLRPELTLYRFRALQLIEQRPEGPVLAHDPP
jgi:hypothetical protein